MPDQLLAAIARLPGTTPRRTVGNGWRLAVDAAQVPVIRQLTRQHQRTLEALTRYQARINDAHRPIALEIEITDATIRAAAARQLLSIDTDLRTGRILHSDGTRPVYAPAGLPGLAATLTIDPPTLHRTARTLADQAHARLMRGHFGSRPARPTAAEDLLSTLLDDTAAVQRQHGNLVTAATTEGSIHRYVTLALQNADLIRTATALA